MRAREFITEESTSQLHDYQEKAISGAKFFPNMDQYYQFYRFGVAMASSPNFDQSAIPAGPASNHPATVSYSSADEEIVQAALKKLGQDQVELSAFGSAEPDDTNRVSPVATRKKNRYGV